MTTKENMYVETDFFLAFFPQLASHPRCTLRGDFGRLLEAKQFCDMVFLVGKVSEKCP